MSRYCIIDKTLGKVTDIAESDDDPSTRIYPLLAMASDVGCIGWVYANGTLAAPGPTPAEARAQQTSALSAACRAAIEAGFTSSALGSPHTYPSTQIDQINLLGRVSQAQISPTATFTFWCADSTGAWAKRTHTAAQMVQVGQDGAAWVQTNSDRLNGADGVSGLLGQVNAAQTVAAVQAVVW